MLDRRSFIGRLTAALAAAGILPDHVAADTPPPQPAAAQGRVRAGFKAGSVLCLRGLRPEHVERGLRPGDYVGVEISVQRRAALGDGRVIGAAPTDATILLHRSRRPGVSMFGVLTSIERRAGSQSIRPHVNADITIYGGRGGNSRVVYELGPAGRLLLSVSGGA